MNHINIYNNIWILEFIVKVYWWNINKHKTTYIYVYICVHRVFFCSLCHICLYIHIYIISRIHICIYINTKTICYILIRIKYYRQKKNTHCITHNARTRARLRKCVVWCVMKRTCAFLSFSYPRGMWFFICVVFICVYISYVW